LDDGWRVNPLSFRYDIAIEEDLIEEVIRVYGYHNIPSKLPTFVPVEDRLTEAKITIQSIQNHLVSRGFRECITYSFISESDQKRFTPSMEGAKLANPISSEMAVMRTSILPGLINALRHNLNHGETRFLGFESGLVFHPSEEGLLQRPLLAGVMYGAKSSLNWTDSSRDLDFYDLKGDVESLFGLARQNNLRFEALTDEAAFHPGQSARIYLNGESVGALGVIHPRIQGEISLNKPCLAFEIQLEKFVKYRLPSFKTVSRFPVVARDLAFVVEQSIAAADLVKSAELVAGDDLRQVVIFDVYQGDNIEKGSKSLAMALIFQEKNRTLEDKEVDKLVAKAVSCLAEELNAEIRS